MYFALFFLIFFAIDILLACRFEILGMIPMYYLVAGVGFFSSFFFCSRISRMPFTSNNRIVPLLFSLHIFLITLDRFYVASRRFILEIFEFRLPSIYLTDWLMLISSGFVFLIISITFVEKSKVWNWIKYSLVAGFLNGLLYLLFGSKSIFFRYAGIPDLIMIFGWLMVMVTLLEEESDTDVYINSNVDVR